MTTKSLTTGLRRSDDDLGASGESPFRSDVETTRYRAALDMIEKRRHEAFDLERALLHTTDQRQRRFLGTRLRATRANLRSWESYAQSNPREPRAVVVTV